MWRAYIITNSLAPIDGHNKIGITSRHLTCRRDEYATIIDPEYHKVFEFPEITSRADMENKVEKPWLKKTKKWMIVIKGKPSEQRANVRPDELAELGCKVWDVMGLKYNEVDFSAELKTAAPQNQPNNDRPFGERAFETIEEMNDNDEQKELPLGFDNRDYQVEALARITDYFLNNDRCLLNWACGIGKTNMALLIMSQPRYRRVLIGVPSVLLLKQWIERIRKCNHRGFDNILAITSSTSTGVRHTTNREYIKKWTAEKDMYVILTTYHSSRKISDIDIDLCVLDECHHLCESTTDSKFCDILQVRSKKQLSLTATMKKVVGKCKIDNFDKTAFGDVIDTKSTLWAIKNKHIADYNIITMRIEKSTLHDIIADVLTHADYQELFLAAFTMLKSIDNIPGLTHIIAYTNTIEHSNVLSGYINALLKKRFNGGRFDSFYNRALDSESLKDTSLEDEVKSFEQSKMGIISSVFIFGEGFDISKVNGVCVAEKMESEIRIVQSIMRGNRLERGNPEKINTIILPFIEGEQHTFEKVEVVVSKMGNQDKNIVMRIRCGTIRNYVGASGDHQHCIVDFDDKKELDHVKLKLRHRKALGLSGTSRIKNEYNYLRSLNIRRGIRSKTIYFRDIDEYERLENPPAYFEDLDPTIWKSWYDFLGVDTSVFPANKDRWRRRCEEHGLTSLNYTDNYMLFNLPEYPDDLYRNFSNMETELDEKKERRRCR